MSEDTNPFAQFATNEPADESLLTRAGEAAKADFYAKSLLGTAIANKQANPTGGPFSPQAGVISPRNLAARITDSGAGPTVDMTQGLGREQGPAQEAARLAAAEELVAQARAGAERPVAVTPAQVAQLRVQLHPEANSVGTYAADFLGGAAGTLVSPENLIMPEMGVAERLGGGVVGRMVNTGLGMAAQQTMVNPAAQTAAQSAGLQGEFSKTEAALAPVGGFVGGALLHGGVEAAGAALRPIGRAGQRFFEGFRTGVADEHPAFRPVGEPVVARSAPEAAPQPEPPLETTHATADSVVLAGERPTGGPVEYQVQKTGEGFTVTRTEHGADGEPVVNRSGTLDAKGESVETGPKAADETEPPPPAVFETKDAAIEFAQRLEGRQPEGEAEAPPPAPEPRGDPAPLPEPPSLPKGPQPQTLVEYIRANGGVTDPGGDLKAMGFDRFPGLIRKDGKPLDQMRESAAAMGYLGHDLDHATSGTTVADFLDRIGGHPTYSIHDEPRVADREQIKAARDHAQAVRDAHAAIKEAITREGIDPDPHVLRNAADILPEGRFSPTGAYEAALANERGMMFRRTDAGAQPPGSPGSVSPNSGATPEITSLQQQGFDLADKLGVPLRQGRLQGGKTTLGQYSTRYGVARVRQVGDFYTVAHEGGHALEQQMPDLAAAVQQAHGELGPLDYDPARRDPREGFAEFFATALTNPNAAQIQAPTFYGEFRRLLGAQKPELLADLDRASEAYRAYLSAPSGARIQSQIVDGERHGWLRETIKRAKENGLPETVGEVLGQFYTRTIASNHPLAKTVRDLTRAIQQEQGGGIVPIDPSRNPIKLQTLFGQAKNGALYQLREGIVPYREVAASGGSLRDALNHASGGPKFLGRMDHESAADLSTYMTSKRASVLWDRYDAGLLDRPPVNFSKADAEQGMADLIAKNPRLEQAAQMVHEFTRNLLTKQRDAGIIKQDLFDKLSADPFYVPLYRDVSDKPLSSGGAGGGGSDGPGMTDTIKRLRGSSRDIIDPIQGVMMQTFLAERTIRHNEIVRGLAGLADRAGYRGKGVVEPVASHELSATPFDLGEQIKNTARQRGLDPGDTDLLMQSVTNAFGDDPIMGTLFKMDVASKRGEPIIFYKDAGELKALRLSAEKEGMALYETLTSLPQVATDLWTQTMTTATKTLRMGVVVHPTFVLSNYIKDQFGVGILRSDYIPLISGLPGLWDEITQTQAARMYSYFGGMSAGTATTGIQEGIRNDISQLTKNGYLSSHLTSLDGLSEITQITEAATRNSIFAKVYAQKLKQGLAPVDAAIEAAYQGTDILDFGRHGSRMLAVRAFVPFLNPHIQGLDKAVRTIMVPLARLAKGDILTADDKAAAANAGLALGKLTVLSGTLGALWASLQWEREEYRDAAPEQKAQNLIIPIGNKVYRMPKPFELGLGFTGGEYAYARLFKDDPRAARQFAEGAWDVLKTPDILAGNPLTKSAVETATGVSLFTGRPIVPDKLAQLDPQYQYNEKTSPIARKVADASNVIADTLNSITGSSLNPWSPMLVDNVIGNLGGYLGKELQEQSKAIFPNEDKPEGRFDDAAFFKRFMINPAKWSATVQRFYEFGAQKTGEFARAANTFQSLYETPATRDQAMEWMRGLSDEKKAYAVLHVGGGDGGKGAFKPDDRALNPIVRAQKALSQVHSIARELLNNNLTNTENDTTIALTPAQRRDAIDAITTLGAMEMRNSLVLVKDQGYVGRPMLSVNDQFEVIKAISPEVSAELARRYATGKVFKTEQVEALWPVAKSALLKDGSDASDTLSDLSSTAKDAKYEFDGERTKRRFKPRAAIPSLAN